MSIKLNRRGFLGSLVAVVAAPVVAPEAAGSWFKRFFQSLKRPFFKSKATGLEYHVLNSRPYRSIEEVEQFTGPNAELLRKMSEDMKQLTAQMIKKFNEDAYKVNKLLSTSGPIRIEKGEGFKIPLHSRTDTECPPSDE